MLWPSGPPMVDGSTSPRTDPAALQVWKVPAAGGDAVKVTREGGLEPTGGDGRTHALLSAIVLPGRRREAVGRARIKQVPVEGGPEVVVLENAAPPPLVGDERWDPLPDDRAGVRRDPPLLVQ